MDCRKALGLGICLLIGAAGCSHNVAMGPVLPPGQANNNSAPVAVTVLPPGAVVQKTPNLPARTPHASTCVAFGDWAAAEANAPDISDSVRQEKREKARKAYQQALTIDPNYLPAYESLASLYEDLQDHAHAVATYRRAAQIFPNEPRVFYELGKCYAGDKQWEPAVQSLARAVQLDPESRQFVDALGWMQARVGLYEDSLTTFRKVHDIAEAHYRLALMLEHLNQPDLCKEHLQIALLKDPRQDRARALLAKLDGARIQRNDGPAVQSDPSVSPVQPVVYVESAKPQLTDVTPVPDETPAPPRPASHSRAVILPPPQIPIQYDQNAIPLNGAE